MAEKYVPQMKTEGADVIVALSHGGIDTSPLHSPTMENASWHLSQVAGIDAILMGHTQVFPDASSKDTRLGPKQVLIKLMAY